MGRGCIRCPPVVPTPEFRDADRGEHHKRQFGGLAEAGGAVGEQRGKEHEHKRGHENPYGSAAPPQDYEAIDGGHDEHEVHGNAEVLYRR